MTLQPSSGLDGGQPPLPTGLRAAMGNFYFRHEPAVYRKALMMAGGNVHDAEDLTHGAFSRLIMWNAAKLLAMSDAHARVTLFKALGHEAIDQWRKRGRMLYMYDYLDSDTPWGKGAPVYSADVAEHVTGNMAINDFWQRAHATLTVDEFALTALRWGLGMTPAEIAEALKTTRTAVTKRCERLRRKLEVLATGIIRFPDDDYAASEGEGDRTA